MPPMNQLVRGLVALARTGSIEHEHLAAVLHTAPVAIVVTDGAHRIMHCNAAAARLFATPLTAIRGKPLRALLTRSAYAQYVHACADASASGDEAMRAEGRRPDGTHCLFDYTLSTFSDRRGHRFHIVAARGAPATAPGSEPDGDDALFRQSEMRLAAIARELHDAVGSSLAGVSLLLATARSFAREPESAALLARSQKQVTMITQQVRQISRGMLPAGQDRGALLAALEHFAAEMNGVARVRCTVRSRGDFEQVPAEAGNHLYRIVQEATTNALRHGKATQVRITLVRGAVRSRLTIQDNGNGRAGQRQGVAPGMGIRSMRARSEAIGGSFVITPHPGCGTRVQVTWNIASETPARQAEGAATDAVTAPGAFHPAAR